MVPSLWAMAHDGRSTYTGCAKGDGKDIAARIGVLSAAGSRS
jgi:hypothetical protein